VQNRGDNVSTTKRNECGGNPSKWNEKVIEKVLQLQMRGEKAKTGPQVELFRVFVGGQLPTYVGGVDGKNPLCEKGRTVVVATTETAHAYRGM